MPEQGEPVLPPDRHQLLRGHLMSEISRENTTAGARTKRRRLGWVAVPALAGGLALAVVLSGGDGTARVKPAQAPIAAPEQSEASGPAKATGSAGASASSAAKVVPASAVELLDHVAQVAASRPGADVKPGQFVYTESMVTNNVFDSSGHVKIDAVPHKREVWLSVDGRQDGLLIEEAGPSLPGRNTKLSGPSRPGIESPTYEYLATLPTDPDALLQKLYDETIGKRPKEERAFKAISELLKEQIAPPAVTAALYQAAAKIPGVTLENDAVDITGRHGIGVARVADGARLEWIFDKDSYAFLGQRGEVVEQGSDFGAPGTVFGQGAVVKRAIVDKAGDRPTAQQTQAQTPQA
ncbi:CU044_5270 family protein [Kitasatospora sp. NPDC096128]|uniref:CU044_5270 family protein n=1 Tax=Kitasatospora sp. NPDC096128 TaxID=3155547 RepID=UPI0033180CA8